MKKIFLTSIFCIFTAANAIAESNPCENIKISPRLDFTTSYGKLRYDYRRNTQELNAMGQKHGLIEKGMYAAGLSMASIDWELQVNTISRAVGDDDICVVPASLDVFIGFQDPITYISKDLKVGSCQYNLVVRHEQQHQQINIVALEYFIPKIKEQIKTQLSFVKPRVISSMDDAEEITNQMSDEYSAIIEPLVARFKASLLKEQQLLDTRQNYKFENSLCK